MVYSIVDKLLKVGEISCLHMNMVNIRDVWHHYQLLKKKSLKNILANGMLGDIGSI